MFISPISTFPTTSLSTAAASPTTTTTTTIEKQNDLNTQSMRSAKCIVQLPPIIPTSQMTSSNRLRIEVSDLSLPQQKKPLQNFARSLSPVRRLPLQQLKFSQQPSCTTPHQPLSQEQTSVTLAPSSSSSQSQIINAKKFRPIHQINNTEQPLTQTSPIPQQQSQITQQQTKPQVISYYFSKNPHNSDPSSAAVSMTTTQQFPSSPHKSFLQPPPPLQTLQKGQHSAPCEFQQIQQQQQSNPLKQQSTTNRQIVPHNQLLIPISKEKEKQKQFEQQRPTQQMSPESRRRENTAPVWKRAQPLFARSPTGKDCSNSSRYSNSANNSIYGNSKRSPQLIWFPEPKCYSPQLEEQRLPSRLTNEEEEEYKLTTASSTNSQEHDMQASFKQASSLLSEDCFQDTFSRNPMQIATKNQPDGKTFRQTARFGFESNDNNLSENNNTLQTQVESADSSMENYSQSQQHYLPPFTLEDQEVLSKDETSLNKSRQNRDNNPQFSFFRPIIDAPTHQLEQSPSQYFQSSIVTIDQRIVRIQQRQQLENPMRDNCEDQRSRSPLKCVSGASRGIRLPSRAGSPKVKVLPIRIRGGQLIDFPALQIKEGSPNQSSKSNKTTDNNVEQSQVNAQEKERHPNHS